MPDERSESFKSSAGNVDGIRRTPTPIFTKVWATVSSVTKNILLIAGEVLWKLTPSFILDLRWKGVFVLSCLAVSFDSLFLYIPIIDQEHKCLDLDKTLRNVALVLRSLTDFAFISHIILLITGYMKNDLEWDDSNSDNDHSAARSWSRRQRKLLREMIAENLPWLSFYNMVSALASLPIPQVAIAFGFFRNGGSKHFFHPLIVNIYLVFQCVLRTSQIVLSLNKMNAVGKWAKGLCYFLLYFIASHALGAFWYVFSIQREISCWDQTCRKMAGCKPIYGCGHSTSLNSTFLNKLCSIDSPNATPFDFGMFRDVHESGDTRSTKFLTKFFYYFWWSLKNLSNFGTNLETSSDIWENCFAILICVIGLLLFITLIGNVQTYVDSLTEESMKKEERRERRLNEKYKGIEKWLCLHGYPAADLKSHNTWNNMKVDKVVKFIDKDVDLEFMYNCFSRHPSATDPLIDICVHALKKVPILRNMDKEDLQKFCDHRFYEYDYLGYATREKDNYITRAGEPLDTLYLIIDGTIAEEDVQTMHHLDCFGEEVVRWAILNHDKPKEKRDSLPKAPVDVKCLTKIVAFRFTADQLIKILKKFKNRQQFPSDQNISNTKRGIKDWLLRNRFPEDLKENIMKNFQVKANMDVDVDVDVDVVFIFRNLPENIKPSIKRHLSMKTLKKVPMLQKMHKYVLEIICNNLQPMVYMMNNYVIRAGEPLGFMIFIVGGKVIKNDRTSSNAATTSSSEITEPSDKNVLGRGDYYGEQLLSWASPNNISSYGNPVISDRDVKCETQVEALILKAEDLKSVASKCGSQWNFTNYCMDSEQLVDDGRDRVANNTAPTSTIEETIRLHQGHDIILEQLVLIRETIFILKEKLERPYSTRGGD